MFEYDQTTQVLKLSSLYSADWEVKPLRALFGIEIVNKANKICIFSKFRRKSSLWK